VLPDDLKETVEWKYGLITFKVHAGYPPRPKIPEEIRLKFGGTADSDEMPYSEEYENWMKEWKETTGEGKAYTEKVRLAAEKEQRLKNLFGQTVFLPQNAGSFRFDDLEPGEYDVNVVFTKVTSPVSQEKAYRHFLSSINTVIVPEKGDSPIDLGRIEVKVP